MADTVEMQDIRGLKIEKALKGFALIDYTFKNELRVTPVDADHVRWYQETSADLTATAPQQLGNISPLSIFTTVEPSWTRNTSYVQKYGVRAVVSMEDAKSSDIDVLARTMLRLVRAIKKDVDSDILTTIRTNSSVQSATSTSAWSGSNGTVVEDLLEIKRLMYAQGYNPEGATIIMRETTYKDMINWLITHKGSSIPTFSSEKIRSGTAMNLLGFNVKVSPNASGGAVIGIIPNEAATWYEHTPLSAKIIDEPGMHSEVRVWEIGLPVVTDPKAVVVMNGVRAS